MRLVAIVARCALLAGLVAACSAPGTPATGQMCAAAESLVAARTLVEQAEAKGAGGDKSRAEALATRAATLATQAHDMLQAITSGDVRSGDTWQALLAAYLHIGQAANALLPASAGTYGSTTSELAAGSRQLAAASQGLPSRCFAASAPPGVGANAVSRG
jgi:hypothetical protein